MRYLILCLICLGCSSNVTYSRKPIQHKYIRTEQPPRTTRLHFKNTPQQPKQYKTPPQYYPVIKPKPRKLR